MCPDCNSTIKADLTASQYKEYEEEARIRYLKAQKVSEDLPSLLFVNLWIFYETRTMYAYVHALLSLCQFLFFSVKNTPHCFLCSSHRVLDQLWYSPVSKTILIDMILVTL